MGPGSSFHRLLWDDADAATRPEGEIRQTDIQLQPDDKIRRVVLCTGKVYYDLLEAREAKGVDDVYLLRVEQLYPFPYKAMMAELARFPNAEVVWCQEEPRNMGYWTFVEPNIEYVLGKIEGQAKRPRYVGRVPTASTATGILAKHKQQQDALVDEALS